MEAISTITTTCNYTGNQCSAFTSNDCLRIKRDLYYAKIQFICHVLQSVGTPIGLPAPAHTNTTSSDTEAQSALSKVIDKTKDIAKKVRKSITIHY